MSFSNIRRFPAFALLVASVSSGCEEPECEDEVPAAVDEAVCYEPTPASGEDSFEAVDGANTHTFEFTLPSDPEGGLVTLIVTGREIFSNVRVVGAPGDDFMINNGVVLDGEPADNVLSFVGAPGVTYAVDVEETWVNQSDGSATVQMRWSLEPARDCYEPNDTPDEAAFVSLGREIEAHLFAGYALNEWPTYEAHYDYYEVEVTQGGRLVATLVPGNNPVNLLVLSADAPDDVLQEGFTISDEPIVVEVDVEPGSYLVRVEPFVLPLFNTFDGDMTGWDDRYRLRTVVE